MGQLCKRSICMMRRITKVKKKTDTNTVTNTCTRIIPLQNNTQLYVHVHHYKQFKGNKKIRLFETNL